MTKRNDDDRRAVSPELQNITQTNEKQHEHTGECRHEHGLGTEAADEHRQGHTHISDHREQFEHTHHDAHSCWHEHEHEHEHGHAHGHHHHSCGGGHAHSPGHVHVAQQKLKKAMALASLVLLAEIVGGFWANSLALLSDAGHMLTDLAALIVAWLAVRVSANPPSRGMTYGYHRATILAALFNGLTLVGIAVYIGVEAYHRLLHPEPVQSVVLFVTAAIGLLVNLYIGLGLRDQADQVNMRSAMLHVFGDAAASAGVIVAGVVIELTGWYVLDPIVSVLIAVIVAFGAWRVIRETAVVLMEGTPDGIGFDEVAAAVQAVPGVAGLQDLHLWSLTSGRHAMSGRLLVDGAMSVRDSQRIVQEIESALAARFGIGHVTLQVQDAGSLRNAVVLECNWHD